MTVPKTKTSTPKLSDLAREVVAPKGAVSTAWPSVRDKCAELGIRFRPWQPGVGRLILAKRADGKYAATIGGTGLSIPRQVGKTFLVGAMVFALCMLYPNLTVIWTAHRLRTAEETFEKMKAFTRRRKIAPHVAKVVLGSGEEEIQFHNGSRILFGARERGFGRGFDEVDVLVFDEAQILTNNALDDMVPATNQSRHPAGALMLFMGTPPKPTDPSEVFQRMRDEALSGEDEDTGWVEFGADPGFKPTPPPGELTEADWRQVEKANPSYPQDTPRESILRMRKKLGPDSFQREGLGIWDEKGARSLISAAAWGPLKLDEPLIDGDVAYGVKFSLDGSTVALAVARRHDDDPIHVELVQYRLMSEGTGWLVDWLEERARASLGIVIDGKAHAGALVNDLRLAKVPAPVIVTPTTQDIVAAHAMVPDAVREGRMTHFNQQILNDAVAHAIKRPIGNTGGWGWQSISETVDVLPLEAVTLAHYGAKTSKRKPGRKTRAVVMA